MGWRRRAYLDQWPGRGPFRNLPPWQRLGRGYYGRGSGRWWTRYLRILEETFAKFKKKYGTVGIGCASLR